MAIAATNEISDEAISAILRTLVSTACTPCRPPWRANSRKSESSQAISSIPTTASLTESCAARRTSGRSAPSTAPTAPSSSARRT